MNDKGHKTVFMNELYNCFCFYFVKLSYQSNEVIIKSK